MKTYCIYLSSGASFTLKADHIDWQDLKYARVFTEGEKKQNKEVYLLLSEVAAIVPVELLPEEAAK